MNSVFVFGYIFLSHFSRDEFSQTNRSKLCHFIFEFVTVGFTILRRRMSFKIIQIYWTIQYLWYQIGHFEQKVEKNTDKKLFH